MATHPHTAHDPNCLFCKIVAKQIPSRAVYEDDDFYAFHDIAPWAPTHMLAVPRGRYVSWDDFSAHAPADLIAGYVRAVGTVARDLGLVAQGYRLLGNVGGHGGQEVPHLHVHLFGGAPLGPMLAG